jgi:hypothetical protein
MALGVWVNVSLIAFAFGLAPSPPMLLVAVGLVGLVGWLIMVLLGWLFDELTEYKIQIIAEGTARALGELE